MYCHNILRVRAIPTLESTDSMISQDGRPAALDNKKDLKVQRIATCSVL